MRRLAIAAAWGVTLLIAANGYAADRAARTHGSAHSAFQPTDVVPPSGPPIVLQLHQGTLIRPPAPVSTVFVADSDIADVTIKTPSLIYVTAKKIGDTVIYAVDANDRVLVNKRVRVEYDLPGLRTAFTQMLPGQLIDAHSVGQDVVLTGTVTTAAMARKAETITAQLLSLSEPPPTAGLNGTPGAATTATAATPAKGATAGGRVIDQLTVATPNQINLRVRIAEVDATTLKELGVSLGKLTGKSVFQTVNPHNDILPYPLLPNAAAGASLENELQLTQPLGAGQTLVSLINALESEGLATNLAEPNLTALSGQKASFLVGGEITIPGALTALATTSPGGPTTATQSTQQLAFGVRLDFTATILDADHIHLKLRPEISALDNATATVVGNTTIPGLDETIAETTVELASGQTFALAGLLRHDTNQKVSKVPGLGDIPVIGSLFRSTSYNQSDTEVVIIVTPYIVRPVLTALATPNDGFRPAHDVSQDLMGSMYRQTPPAPARGPVSPGGQGLVGTVGFRLD